MDPAIVAFGFGIGLLVGMTGMGGASLMTPLLILIFGVQPVTAIGTDIFYAAVTKTFGGIQHLRAGTVHKGLAFWMAVGSVPAAIAGVGVIAYLAGRVGEDKLDGIVFGILGATLLVVGLVDGAAHGLHPRRDQGALRPPPASAATSSPRSPPA